MPLSVGTVLQRASDDADLLDTSQYSYSGLIGSLLYLAVCTRPDIAQAVGALARYMAQPTTAQWKAALGVLRYLSSTADQGIVFGGGKGLAGYSDADYAGDPDSRRSTTGYVFLLYGGAISWSSRLQPTVAQSTVEAEYMAAASAVKEALWIRKLLHDLGIDHVGAVQLYSDNQGALQLLKHPIASQRSKHIDVMHHFARERVARGEVVFAYCPTGVMVADAMTKPLPESKFVYCRSGMGMR